MRCLRVLAGIMLVGVLASSALAADMGMSRAEFIKRFNAAGTAQGLPVLSDRAVHTQKIDDKNGPMTLKVFAMGTLAVMLNTYDATPDRVVALAILNKFDDNADNNKATALGVRSAIAALNPKMSGGELDGILNALGVSDGLQGLRDGQKREHVVGAYRYVSGSQQGKGVTIAIYPIQ